MRERGSSFVRSLQGRVVVCSRTSSRTHHLTESATVASRPEPVFFQGRYRRLEKLYVGQETEVWTVADALRPERALVLKSVPGRASLSERAARLESEYRLLSSMRHPGLARARDFGYDLADDRTFLVSDRAPGRTLESQVPLGVEAAIGLVVDVCRVLSTMHARSRLHLDVKPRNIMHDPDSGRTTLLDLDLAGFPEDAAGRGTPPYASPEAMGAGPVPDARSDVYSLGVTLYEMLTGRPAPAERLTEPLDTGDVVDAWLRELVKDMTAPAPDDRPPAARDVIRRLRASGRRWPDESFSTRSTVLSYPPLTGRRSEVKELLQAIPPTARRQAKKPVVLVRGPSGVGKSRIVAEAAIDWRCAGIRVLRVVPEPGPVGTLQPVYAVLEQLGRLSSRSVAASSVRNTC
ncbi:MAG: hypothetical protein CMJ83_05910 [Planctomycetes bacterium]|nr:hypothetical protein [Planctomycetota bacterium]